MGYVKPFFAGVAMSLVAMLLFIAVLVFVVFSFSSIAATGSGGLGAVSMGLSPLHLLVVGIAGFVLGFWLMRRRDRRRRA